MQRVLRLILVVLLSSLTACQTGLTPTYRTTEASAQSTGEKTPQQSLSNNLEGHYEGIKLDFFQDTGLSIPVVIDFEPTGTCRYSYPSGDKQPCHWERSTDRITVRVTDGDTLPFKRADDKLTYFKSDGFGGGVCIQLVKDRAVSDTGDDLCQGAMTGMPPPPRLERQ